MKREIHKIDAEGQILGRLACKIALLLRGKNKIEYQPHLDLGDFVEVANCKKIKLTGNKLEMKKYIHHSKHPGGLKIQQAKTVLQKKPQFLLRRAVYMMLPRNKQRAIMIKRLKFLK